VNVLTLSSYLKRLKLYRRVRIALRGTHDGSALAQSLIRPGYSCLAPYERAGCRALPVVMSPVADLVHETIHRVEKLTEIAIAVEVDLEGAYSRCFAVTP
jgi:hypothetical protein